MNHPNPNPPPLFCRNTECQVSYEHIDNLGICDDCGTANIALVWKATADFGSVIAYTTTEAYNELILKLQENPVEFLKSLTLETQL